MGFRGPPKTPNAILRMRGSRRATKKQAESTPVSAPKPLRFPRPPAHFDRAEKAFWREIVGHLAELGVLHLADGPALERYCAVWFRWRRVEDSIKKHGAVIPVRLGDGRVVFRARPEADIAMSCAAELRALEDRFGLNPAARARLRVERAEEEADPMDAFLAELDKSRGTKA